MSIRTTEYILAAMCIVSLLYLIWSVQTLATLSAQQDAMPSR
jgi:hypothetical protein